MEKIKKLKFKKPLNIVFQICAVLLVIHVLLSFFPLHLQVSKAKATSGTFQKVGTSLGIGNLRDSIVGQGTTPGSQKYYLSYQNAAYALDLVAIDPNNNYTATTYTAPIAGAEEGAFALGAGSDNNIYLGTESTAHILKFNTQTTTLTDLGTVPNDPVSHVAQGYLWKFSVSPYDHKMYGCTYPSADLVSYDTTTNTMTNLGSMDTSNQYAHYCVADQTNPYIYVGTGAVSEKLVAYNIQTGVATTVASSATAGFANVWLGSNNTVYGQVGSQKYILSNGTATATSSSVNVASTNVFSNGDKITIDSSNTHVVITHTDNSTSTYPYTYQGGNISIFRVGLGSDGNIYTSTVLPLYLEKYVSTTGFTNLGQIGGGEAYSLFPYNNLLNIAAYSAEAPLLSYNPSSAINPIPYTNPTCGATTNNPQCTSGVQDDWRPEALTSAPNNLLYVGSVGGYGQLDGILVAWNTQNNTESEFRPFTNLGITSLISANNCQGVTAASYCIVGGTTTSGGSGTTSTATNAPLFIWDTTTNTVVNQYSIPNVSNVTKITDLIVDPANNYVYGVAIASGGSYLFIFDPTTGTFFNGGTPLPFAVSTANSTYNSVAIGSDGNIWGLTSTGIFTINLTNNKAQLVATSPVTITAGFGFVKDSTNGDKIYFASNADLYVYTLPFTSSSSSSTTPTSTPEPGFNFPTTPTPTISANIVSPTLPLNTIPLLENEEIQDTIQPTPHVAKYITYLASSGKAGTIPEETTTSLIYYNLQLTINTFLQTMNHLFGNISSHFFH